MDKLLKIIYDKSKKNKILDEYDIFNILVILLDEKTYLNDYLEDLYFDISSDNTLASYHAYTKRITIYSNTIDSMIEKIEKDVKLDYKLSKNLYKNLTILQIILHELEHANQIRILNKEKNVESYLLCYSTIIDYNKCVDADLLYNLNPEERLADIKSYDEVINIYNLLEYNDQELLKLLEKDYNNKLLKAFNFKNNNISSPTIKFFKLADKLYILDYFDWYDDNQELMYQNSKKLYDLDERLLYGFPVKKEEYLNKKKVLKKK